MKWTRPFWLRLAALSGFVSVAVGAFAAHVVTVPATKELLRTGSTYEAIHALATLACAVFVGRAAARAGIAAGLFLVGSAMFCGSLYALAAGAPRIVGAITPFGGLAFLAGWGVLAWAAGAGRKGRKINHEAHEGRRRFTKRPSFLCLNFSKMTSSI